MCGLPILVVDDNATNRRICTDMLTHWGLRPTAVADAYAALTALRQAVQDARPFALVLLDAMMPDLDGYALAQLIQAEPLLAATPLLMLTSADQSLDSSSCQAIGIAMSLTKPVGQSDLWQAVLMVLRPQIAPAAKPVAPSPPRPKSQRQLRILLAEDNLVNQKLAVRLLEKWGHVVRVASTGQEALEALHRQSFDVILMDVQMPDMGGLEATVAIRQREQTTLRHIPIIAMTAHAMQSDRERCLAAGMDDYVVKPFQPQNLFETIERVVAATRPVGEQQHAPCPTDIVFDAAATLARLEGDMALLQDMVSAFLTDWPHTHVLLQQAIATRDATALGQLTHTLTGAVGSLGAWGAMAAAQRLEQVGDCSDFSQVITAYTELEAEMARLIPQLTTLMHVDIHGSSGDSVRMVTPTP